MADCGWWEGVGSRGGAVLSKTFRRRRWKRQLIDLPELTADEVPMARRRIIAMPAEAADTYLDD